MMREFKATQNGGGEVILTLPSTPIVPNTTHNPTNPNRWGGSKESIVAVNGNGEFKTRAEIQLALDSYRGMEFDALFDKGFRLITSFAPLDDLSPVEELEVRKYQPWGGEYFVAHFTHHAEARHYTSIYDEDEVFEQDADGNVEVAIPHCEDENGNYIGYVAFDNATYKVNIIVH